MSIKNTGKNTIRYKYLIALLNFRFFAVTTVENFRISSCKLICFRTTQRIFPEFECGPNMIQNYNSYQKLSKYFDILEIYRTDEQKPIDFGDITLRRMAGILLTSTRTFRNFHIYYSKFLIII